MTDWTRAFPLAQIPADGVKVFRAGSDRVAVFRLEEDTLYAIDDRCPHEGWPLAKGAVKGTVVTCAWHNYKFDLRDGRCVLGEERARTYPVRVRDGAVELDLSPPDPETLLPGLWSSLEEGLLDGRMGRAVRDAVRLLQAGVAPQAIALRVARLDALHGEYGPTHGFAVAADVVRYLGWFTGLEAAVPLAQAMDVMADGTKRRPARPRPDPVATGIDGADPDDVRRVEARLEALVEAEDVAGAEGLLRGMIEEGWALDRLERTFLRLTAAHFLGFGHRLIYTIKAFDLLRAADSPDAVADILPGLLYGIVTSTREDTLPRWRAARERIAAIDGELELLFAHCRDQAVSMDPRWRARLDSALTDDPEERALYMLEHTIRAGVPLLEIVDALSAASAQRMLRFDPARDADDGTQDDWLSVSHAQTTVHALRAAVSRLDSPEILPLFILVGRFVHRTKVLDLPAEARWAPPESPPTADAAAVWSAVAAGDESAALDAAWALLADPEGREALREGMHRWAQSDALTAPIVVAHGIKNVVAAWDEYDAMGDPAHILGVLRFAVSAPRQRWVRRRTLEAIAFVSEGKIPRTLAQ
jgi:nitrite reductase/ring-hydroxylating ferredoxin subunit